MIKKQQITDQGLVLKITDSGSKDRIVTVLTKHYGKLKIINFNAKSKSNSFNSIFQPFNTVLFIAEQSRGLPVAHQAEIACSRHAQREDFDRLLYSSVIAELTDYFIQERDGDMQLFALIANCFDILNTRNPRISALIAALKIIEYAGLKPHLLQCRSCGRKIDGTTYFDFENGGSLCPKCAPAAQSQTDFLAISLLDKLYNLDFECLSLFSVKASDLSRAEGLLYAFIMHHTAQRVKSLDFILSLSSH